MRYLALAAATCLASSLAIAQNPTAAPKHACEKPEVPSKFAMERDKDRTAFQRKLKDFETCVKAFIAERQEVITANNKAANAAIDEYNALVAEVNAVQGGTR